MSDEWKDLKLSITAVYSILNAVFGEIGGDLIQVFSDHSDQLLNSNRVSPGLIREILPYKKTLKSW
jgi:hypothetical protein